MVKNIAVFGATGFPGLPVVNELIHAGYKVSVLSSDVERDKLLLPEGVHLTEGNWMYHRDLKRFLAQQDAVYCSLSVDLNEKADDFHAETDGLREIINASLECGIKRIAYMSSMLQYLQVESEDQWWVFRVKKDAVNYVRDCGMPFTVFYPSTFMEVFETSHRRGKTIELIGESRFPVYFISVKDYALMVARSFQTAGTEDKEYFVQGGDCYNMQEAARLFIRNHSHSKLRLKKVPLWLARIYALFNISWKFKVGLAEALNGNNEIFVSDDTWKELGRPEHSFAEYAKHAL